MKHRSVWALVCVAGTSVAIVAACNDQTDVSVACGEIPAGGCPKRGEPCNDRACAAVYTCAADGIWSLVQKCPLRDAGPPSDAGITDVDARPARDASFLDGVPGASGGPGCEDLQAPDCPLSRMQYCPSNQCCQCEDLFYCQDGGWQPWGACTDGGALAPDR